MLELLIPRSSLCESSIMSEPVAVPLYSAMCVVGIGASAGGVEPLERFFASVSESSGLAYVVIQHLSPDYRSQMDELLRRRTSMPIVHIEDGMLIRPDYIHLAPPRSNVTISSGKLRLTPVDSVEMPNLPIDVFFHSLAENCAERGIAVVLSGTGSDGAKGVKAVHDAGGLVIAQELSTAGFDGMPRRAGETGVVDLQAPAEAMPEWIIRYSQDPKAFREQGFDSELAFVKDQDSASIFKLVRRVFGIDFSCYRATTITRRLERRVQLTHSKSLAEYCQKLHDEPDELDHLYRDLLVEVTQFFRDAEAFDVLRNQVIPEIVNRTRNRGEIRVWVPGCATGEEAYSLAMLFDDAAQKANCEADIRVFATDVHGTSLEAAGLGVYSEEGLAHVPAEIYEKYFSKVGDQCRVNQTIRQMVVCARHDITRDPPFTRVDLVSCRNVLIYLEPAVQQQVFRMFHFGMRVGGVLFLGPSETLGPLNNEFEVISAKWRVFRKTRNTSLGRVVPVRMSERSRELTRRTPRLSPVRREEGAMVPEARLQLVDQYVPPTMLINDKMELVHTFGTARQFLELPEGRPTLDITRMLKGQLGTSVSAAVHRARSQQKAFSFDRVQLSDGPDSRAFRVTVMPFRGAPEPMFLVSLEELENLPRSPSDAPSESYDVGSATKDRIEDLERELGFTTETLQTTVEELETSNEELQATNQELVASNEELQSTNEELQSVNEELTTVNVEHQRRIDDLTSSSQELDLVLDASAVSVVMLSMDLKIEWFTTTASELLGILPHDIGRPLAHLALPFKDFDLITMLIRISKGGKAEDHCVTSQEGGEYMIHSQVVTRPNGSRRVIMRCINMEISGP